MVKSPSNKVSDTNDQRSDRTAIRMSFRVPVELQDDIAVMINNETYQVLDIGPEGINITIKDPSLFTIGQFIQNCELILSDNRIKNLTARIVHSSKDSDEAWNTGIHWIALDDNAQEQIVNIISKIKQKLRQNAAE